MASSQRIWRRESNRRLGVKSYSKINYLTYKHFSLDKFFQPTKRITNVFERVEHKGNLSLQHGNAVHSFCEQRFLAAIVAHWTNATNTVTRQELWWCNPSLARPAWT